MKVLSVTLNRPHLSVTPVGNRYYRVAGDVDAYVQTDVGRFTFGFKEGFISNFRSGGPFVDRFIDQVGDEKKSLIYLIHDCLYTPCKYLNGEHPLSRKMSDEFLRDGLVWAGMPKWEASLVYDMVRLFGRSAYEDDDHLTQENSGLFTFLWLAK